MQTSKTTSTGRLAEDLQRFFARVMKGDQGELFALIAELDLTMAQMRGMFVLDAADHGLALTELAPKVGLSVAAAGRSVDGLVRHGFVERSEDPDDRRIKRLALTDTGRATLERINEARLTSLRRFTAALGEHERAALSTALAAIFEQWDHEQAKAEAQ